MDNESKIGRIYLTKKSSEPEKSNELSFLKGDLVTLASDLTEDGEHYQAVSSDGSMGLIHHSIIFERDPIPLVPMPWFHSTISRLDAEKLLNRNQDGHFLLRTSQNTKGVYALAMSTGGSISHYLVAMDFTTKKLTINGEKYYDNLPELVEAHTKEERLIGTLLSHPLGRRGTLNFYIDQDSLKKTWSLPKTEVELGKTLGQGEFGEVCVAKYRGEMQIAAKVIHENKQSASSMASFIREASILTHLKHKNLVQLVGLVYQGSTMKCILTELMGKGSLQKYLISRGRSVISQVELLSFARDVCNGMVYISSQGFVHRDLAARNILLNSNGQAKISDFGLARKAVLHVPHEGGKFPVKWTAPEALKESKFSVESDVWSYGVLLWEIFSYGRTPYPSVPTGEVLESIEDGNIMDPPDHCPDEMYDLMCVCWEIEPGHRPSFLSLKHQLARSFQKSRTPNSSPVVTRKAISMPNVDQLISSPVAVKTYQEAPSHRKATLFLGNIIFLGLQGSGKTSLLRNLTGETFRLVELPSLSVDIMENYSSLMDNLNWLPSTSGLMYEDELVRIIVEDLLKHMNSVLTKLAVNPPEDGHQRTGIGSSLPPLPPLPPPPPPRKRSHSFSEPYHIEHDPFETSTVTNRYSGNFEVLDSASSSESALARAIAEQHPRYSKGKKGLLSKIFAKGHKHHHYSPGRGNTRGHNRKVKRNHSDSVKRTHYASDYIPSSAGSIPSTAGSTPDPPRHYSPLPERLTEKIKAEFDQCSGGNLSPKFLARLVDTPGNPSFRVLQSLFLTENSICIVAFDASRDILSPLATPLSHKKKPLPESKQNGVDSLSPNMEDSYLCHIMAEISSVCVQWSGYRSDMTICGPRIILVGTHSDKAPSSVTHRNFELLRDEIKVSPYHKYVAVDRFIISNSSIIERSSMDDLKKFVKEKLKKLCRQQVPLKWLRCVRRFQGLLNKKNYLVSLTDAKKLVSEICDISIRDPEISEVINFLHQNQVLMHFPLIYHLKDLVISSARWFSQQVSKLFAAPSIDLEAELGPSELVADQELLRSTGFLTNQLLDYVWREKESQVNKDELLTVMNKMDLLCCMTSETHLISLSASIGDLTAEVKSKKHMHRHKIAVSLVIVPALVEELQPSSLSSLPSYNVDPMIFRFRDHVPNGLFLRLLVRCVQSYPNNFSLFQHAATFEFDDESSFLLLTEGSSYIRLTLHHKENSSTASQSKDKHVGLYTGNGLLSNSPNVPTVTPNVPITTVSPDACMAVLMFVRATINDLTQQWTPHLDFDLCVKCSCKCPPIPMDAVVDIDDALAEKARTVTSRLRTNGRISKYHFIILNDVDSLLHQVSLRCEMGNPVPLSSSLLCWFGEELVNVSPSSPTGDIEYVTDEDIDQVSKVLGLSWKDLGQTLGFSEIELERFSLASHSPGKKMLKEWQTLHSKNATFFALLGALEIIQRRDIADNLVDARILTGDCVVK